MPKSFIDFSSKISMETHSLLYLNRKNNSSYELIVENSGFHTENLAVPEQIHSTKVKYIDTPGNYNDVDGLITDNPKIILTLKVADCVPIYLYDKKNECYGLIHSGWRGTKNKIITNALNIFFNDFKSLSENILIVIGPHIQKCCYEIDWNVAQHFSCLTKNHKNKWLLDLSQEIKNDILDFKIPKHIKIVAEFPMTVTGKMQKFIMRDQYAEELSVF